jgi:hypothetical protein
MWGMPVRYERDDARRRVVVTVHGAFETSDMLAVSERQRADDTWNYGTLLDLRRIAGHPTVADLRDLMSQASAHPPAARRPGPIALLATEAILYARLCGCAVMVQGKLTIEVFSDLDDADRWLATNTSP